MVSVLSLTIAILALASSSGAVLLTVTDTSNTSELLVAKLSTVSVGPREGKHVRVTAGSWKNIVAQFRGGIEEPLPEKMCLDKIGKLLQESNDFSYELTDSHLDGTYSRNDVTWRAVEGWISFELKQSSTPENNF